MKQCHSLSIKTSLGFSFKWPIQSINTLNELICNVNFFNENKGTFTDRIAQKIADSFTHSFDVSIQVG